MTDGDEATAPPDVARRSAAIGRRLREARKSSAETQASLAGGMRERGHAWSENTVYQIESGRQPLRVVEAIDAAEVLGVTVGAILTGPAGPGMLAIEGMLPEYEHHSRALRLAVWNYEQFRLRLAHPVDEASASPDAEIDPLYVRATWIVATPSWDVSKLDAATLYETGAHTKPRGGVGDGEAVRAVVGDLREAMRWRDERRGYESIYTPFEDGSSDDGKR